MNKKLLFAAVTARASASEQRQILDGVITQAFKMNIDIAVLSNIYNASEYNDFITLENNIYSLIDSEKPDGFIFTDDSFMNPVLRERVLGLLSSNDIPVVCVGSGTPQFPSADSSTMSDIEKLTDHLIEVHGFSDIDILTGPEHLATSHHRVSGYRHSLEKHGIAFHSENVIYGDFWTCSGENTAKQYIEKERRMPQAVICANDYMAYGLCDTFMKHGVKIPEEITVAGYEYIGERTDHYPVLTTFQRNRTALGAKVLMMLYSIVSGEEQSFDISLDGRVICGDTCSCGADLAVLSEEIQEKHRQQFYFSLNDTGMLEQYLTESRNISDLISALSRHSYFIPNLSGLYLCLYEDWCVSSVNRKESHRKTDDMICYTINDIYKGSSAPEHFSRKDMFPASLQNEDIPNSFYCCPVFFMEKDFGYMIVRYDKVNCFGESFRNWLKIVSNALEFLRMKNDIDYLMQYQNLSEFHDSATGLFNREGFLNEIKIAVQNADPAGKCMLYILRINADTETFRRYFYDKTDFISDIVNVMRSLSSGRGKICGRLDEDLFAVAAADYRGGESYGEMFSDRADVLLYGYFEKRGIYGADIYTSAVCSGKLSEFDYAENIAGLENETRHTADEKNKKIMMSGYSGYRELRSRIYSKPHDDISSAEACRIFCLSSGHFRVMYRSYFGISFHQDCIRSKIMLAKHLLVSTKMNIASIAEKCGYDNDKYFMHQFRLTSGITPNQYREMKI